MLSQDVARMTIATTEAGGARYRLWLYTGFTYTWSI